MRIQDKEKGVITGYVEDCHMDPKEAAPVFWIEVPLLVVATAAIIALVLRLLGIV